MRAFAALFLLASLGIGAGAQTAAGPANPDAERTRIAVERARLETGFLTEDAACYKRFFVNSCLDDVNTRRREMLATLRTQEILLNEQERKLKGAEQIRRIEEKSSAENQQREADQRAKAALDYESRLAGQKEKQQSRTNAQAAEQANAEARAGRLQAKRSRPEVPSRLQKLPKPPATTLARKRRKNDGRRMRGSSFSAPSPRPNPYLCPSSCWSQTAYVQRLRSRAQV
jgi:colicin import membrane protein